MHNPSREQIRTLTENTARPCVSILMPIHRKGPDARQNPVRYKNLLREAEEKLNAAGLKSEGVLDVAKTRADDPHFWDQPVHDGLVFYCAPGVFEHVHLHVQVEEMVVAGDHFYLRPLLEANAGDTYYYVLALSQGGVRLIRCSQHSSDEVPLPESVPRNIAEALQFVDPEDADGDAQMRGYRTPDSKAKVRQLEFFRMVDKGLHEILRQEKAPMVVAAVEYLMPIYREANTYQHLLDEGIAGNAEGLNGEQLREKAWPLVEPALNREREAAANRFGELESKGQGSKVLKEIVRAAQGGRVDSLFVASGLHQWGTSAGDRVSVHKKEQNGDEDLLDTAALQTFLHGGKVYTVDPEHAPHGAQIAALFRY